jgi:signal transduction histidine kinase
MVLNAREALGAGGRIEVRTQQRGNRVVLSVIDNGCGMTPAFVRDSLFRPFQSTKKKGLGIGLFQSRAIVLAHGGGVQVESEVGKGTSFHASFPVSGAP